MMAIICNYASGLYALNHMPSKATLGESQRVNLIVYQSLW